MTDAELSTIRSRARLLVGALRSTPVGAAVAVWATHDIDTLLAEVDRLRRVEAAGERLARDVGRFVEEVEDTDDVHVRRQALRLGLALDAWRAARRDESAP